ncbi:MAG: O-antigen ligase family protein [Candidatus Limnocylindrales bacterium]
MDTAEQTRLQDSAIGATAQWPSLARLQAYLPAPGRLALGTAVAALSFATLLVAALNQHSLYFHAGLAASAIRAVVPLAAAAVTAWAVFQPRRAFLIVLLLTPCWNAVQVSWQLGPIQVILQTIFVAALGAGTLRWLRSQPPEQGESLPATESGPRTFPPTLTGARRWAAGFRAYRFAEVATLGLLGIAILSTLQSEDPTLSGTVLLHGILEPVALGAILLALRPTKRYLLAAALMLGAAAALGSVINVLQVLPSVTSLATLQAQRLIFARVTYFNVGLFGVILATVVPLILAALAARRHLPIPKWAVPLLAAALVACVVGLFLSLSKSAFLATTGGAVLLFVLLVQGWKRRAAIVITAAALSSIVIPWPALVLQFAPPIDNAYRSAAVALVGESRFDSWNPDTLAGYGSLTERFYAVEGAVHMSMTHPLLGIGLDQFGRYYVLLGYRPAQAKDNFDHAHSLFPEIAAELGLGALVLVVVIFASCLWALWRVYRAPPDRGTRALAAALMASLVAWVVATTAYGADIYRPDRELSSDIVAIAVIVAASIALARVSSVRRQPAVA